MTIELQKIVAVSAGHNPRRPGYTHNAFYSEYSEMAVLAGLLVNNLQHLGHAAYLIGTGGLRSKVANVNDLNADCVIELHLNAGGGHGYETLYCPGSPTGKELASRVNSSLGHCMRARNRGVKEGWYKMDKSNGPDYFLEKTNCPAVITELFFLDSEDDRAKFLGRLEILNSAAHAIATGISEE